MRKYKLSLEKIKYLYYRGKQSQQQIADKLKVSQWVISHRMKEAGLAIFDKTRNLNPRKYSINHQAFDKITPKTAWLIGWMISDGFVSNKVRFGLKVAAKDTDIVEKLKQHIQYTGPIYSFNYTSKQTNKIYHQVAIQPTSERIVGKLLQFGIHPNKSLNIKFPPPMRHQPENIIRNFIRGVFEGDGSLLLERNRSLLFQIVGTKALCNGIRKQLVKFVNVKSTKLTNNIKGHNHYALRYRGRFQVLKITNWVYHNARNNVLDRKYNHYLVIRRQFSS